MRNVFLFIRRYFNLLFFLLLQAAALTLLFRYNKFHQAAFMDVANEVSGRVNIRFNNVETYFSLKKDNEKLREQNASLLNLLKSDYDWPDSVLRIATDTIRIDSLEQYRKYLYLPAKVISTTVNAQNNYLMLHRGSNQGVGVNMAVVGPQGVIGTVVNVSANMAVVMSMLHRQSRIVAVLKKGSGFGEVVWDGKDPSLVQLVKVPKTIMVNKGDSVVTSQYSDKYPPGHLVGIVVKVEDDKGTSTYNLTLRTATNFYNVQHAFVVKNMQKEELDALEKQIKKDNE
jgi:rod shape-determining protein MreC